MYGRERRGEESARRKRERERRTRRSKSVRSCVCISHSSLRHLGYRSLALSPTPPYHTHTHSRLACESVCGFMKNYNSQHQAYRAINSTERTPTRTCVWLTRSLSLCVCGRLILIPVACGIIHCLLSFLSCNFFWQHCHLAVDSKCFINLVCATVASSHLSLSHSHSHWHSHSNSQSLSTCRKQQQTEAAAAAERVGHTIEPNDL